MRLRLKSSVALVLAAFTVALSQTTPQAQDAGAAVAPAPAEPPADLAAGKRLWTSTADCVRCHGWAGNGAPEGPGFPAGANLREMNLPPDVLAEIIRCGLPGTEMPFFGRGAWYNSTCYGMTSEQVGPRLPPADGHQLSAAQIATLVNYIEYQVMGHGPINRADCEAFYGADAPQCAAYQ
jgi:hypothetical protein